jgi:hypothetical protein
METKMKSVQRISATFASIAVVFFGAGISAARAGAIFNVTGVFADTTTLSGTLNIDTTAGTVLSGDLTTTVPNAFHFTFVDFQEIGGSGYVVGFAQTSPGFPLIDLFFPTTLVNYSGGGLCVISAPCAGSVSTFVFFGSNGLIFSPQLQSGTATTPEPSSSLTIAVGLLLFLWRSGSRTRAAAYRS